MNEEIMITKEDLVSWIDRTPSDNDLDLCSYLANAVKNQYNFGQENTKLKERIDKAIEYIEKYTREIEGITGYYYTISDTEELLEILKESDVSE